MLSDKVNYYGIHSISEYRKALTRPLDSYAAIGYALTHLMRGASDGFACAVFLNHAKRHICTVPLKRDGIMAYEPVLDIIKETLASSSSSYFLIAHNHKHDELRPSGADLVTTDLVRRYFNTEKTVFIDHFIISGNRWSTVFHPEYRDNYVNSKDPI